MIIRPRQVAKTQKTTVVQESKIFSKLPAMVVAALGSLLLSSCSGINVMGRKVSDNEYKASYDRAITREKRGLKPTEVHDEHGRIPSWDEYWNHYTGGHDMGNTSTAQSRRLHQYIIKERRKAGLPELTTHVE